MALEDVQVISWDTWADTFKPLLDPETDTPKQDWSKEELEQAHAEQCVWSHFGTDDEEYGNNYYAQHPSWIVAFYICEIPYEEGRRFQAFSQKVLDRRAHPDKHFIVLSENDYMNVGPASYLEECVQPHEVSRDLGALTLKARDDFYALEWGKELGEGDAISSCYVVDLLGNVHSIIWRVRELISVRAVIRITTPTLEQEEAGRIVPDFTQSNLSKLVNLGKKSDFSEN